VEVVRAVIDAFNEGDWEAVFNHAAPNSELDFSRAVGPVRGVFKLDQMRGFLDEAFGVWESVRIEPHEFIESGEHVVVPLTLHVAGRDGIEAQARVTWTWTIRDGAIERACMYQERRVALEAAGLSE
jgi:ketosteroid isomerase-like protein